MTRRFEDAALRIADSATGIYLAHPTTAVFKPTYRGHKTIVNHNDTKVGIVRNSFAARRREYMATFQSEVAFYPLLEAPADVLPAIEQQLMLLLRGLYSRSGTAREWFRTTERQAIAELVWRLSGVNLAPT
jgi:hypothetical protein